MQNLTMLSLWCFGIWTVVRLYLEIKGGWRRERENADCGRQVRIQSIPGAGVAYQAMGTGDLPADDGMVPVRSMRGWAKRAVMVQRLKTILRRDRCTPVSVIVDAMEGRR